MRVAAVFMSMPVGGAEDLALLFARRLRASGVSTEFVCLGGSGPLGDEVLQLREPPLHLPRISRSKRFSLPGCFRFSNWLREGNFDLVHSHTFHSHRYAMPAALRAGIPVVLHHHKTYEKMKWHREVVFRWCLRRCAALVTLSGQTAADLQRIFGIPGTKVFSIPNAADSDAFFPATPSEKQALRAELSLPADAFLLGTVASLQKVKNHESILRALPDAPPNVFCVFVGDGPERNHLGELADRLGVAERVRFTGNQRPVAPWMRAMDLFVFPSFWEGQSLALLQALACEIPILASNIEGNTALLGTTHPGLVPPDAPGLLAEKIRRAAEQPDFLDQLCSAGRACRPPTLEDTCERMLHVYQTAMESVA